MTRTLCLLCVSLSMLFGCAKKKPPDPRTEPWPAVPSAVASALLPDELQTFVLGPPSRVWFEVPGREAKPKGELVGLSGKVELLFADAQKTRATIHADLSTLSMLDESGVPSDSYTREARNWLDLGVKQAEAVRKRFSTATFELKSVGADPTRLAALVAGGEKASRRAAFPVKGELLIHGYRVPLETEVELEFQSGVSNRAIPDRLVIRSRRPLIVSLQTHDIKPRNDSGTLLAHELKTLGARVGRQARVHFELHAELSGAGSEKKH